MQIRLNTVQNGRKTIAAIARRYEKGEIDEATARTLRYLLDGVLSWFKLERDIDIEERIDALEASIGAKK